MGNDYWMILTIHKVNVTNSDNPYVWGTDGYSDEKDDERVCQPDALKVSQQFILWYLVFLCQNYKTVLATLPIARSNSTVSLCFSSKPHGWQYISTFWHLVFWNYKTVLATLPIARSNSAVSLRFSSATLFSSLLIRSLYAPLDMSHLLILGRMLFRH